MALADWARLVAAALGVLLSITVCAALTYAKGWDQRMRFLVLLGYAVITVNGQLESLGRPPSWRTFALAVVGALAVASTGVFVVRHVRHNAGRGADAGRSNDQRRVLGTGPPAGRAGGHPDRARPPGGSATP